MNSYMADFKEKIVLVSGSGRGIGRALAEAFAAHGACVAVNDINPDNALETVRRIQSNGGQAKDYVFDVAKKMPVQAMVDAILNDWERIDILVNNAGVEPHASILDMDEWDWQRTLDVNLSGPFLLMQSVGRVMREPGGLTREAAREFAAYGIRVNAVCPGVIETEMTAALRQNEAMMRKWLEDIPQGRLGNPQDVAGLVLFLCGDAAAYLTGQAINVDGGKVMC
jgi:3-oxoacyl-[acyl-carrier protein] reductase